jgi:hypothetical protein
MTGLTIRGLRLPRVTLPRETILLALASLAGIAATGPSSGGGGGGGGGDGGGGGGDGGTPEPEPGPTPPPPDVSTPWTPKWPVGQQLHSTSLPSALWVVISINYPSRCYLCQFTFAGATQTIWVYATNLEGADIY